jgi:hypothetical protein
MVRGVPRRPPPAVENRLPVLLAAHGIPWSELGRRTLLPQRQLGRLRAPAANPHLAVAERVAAALGVAVEDIWRPVPRLEPPA